MEMRWLDLMFIHYRVPLEKLRALVPRPLEVDTFDGEAWIGVVPFRMSHVVPRGVPPLPWFSAFAELNVRTYVKFEGRAGVWFFSLDAANPFAVRAARRFFHLPYFDAEMSSQEHGGAIEYRSRRVHRGAAEAEFRAVYRPVSDVFRAQPGSLDHWLTERYCLYAENRRGELFRTDVHHEPWPLQAGEIGIEKNTMLDWLGVQTLDSKPLLHFARRLDVVAWFPERT